MDTDSFIILIKIKDLYENIADDLENRIDTSNYDVNIPWPTANIKTVIGLIKDKLGGNIMTEFTALRQKTYSYLMDDGNNDKKAKGTKQRVIIRILHFNGYKGFLVKNEIILKSKQRFKSEAEKINKIALSSNDDKKLQTYFDRITSYGASVGKACRKELQSKYK